MKRITLTVNETAKALGISIPMLRKMIKNGEIPFFRCGRKILIRVEALNEWMTSQEKNTLQEEEKYEY